MLRFSGYYFYKMCSIILFYYKYAFRLMCALYIDTWYSEKRKHEKKYNKTNGAEIKSLYYCKIHFFPSSLPRLAFCKVSI